MIATFAGRISRVRFMPKKPIKQNESQAPPAKETPPAESAEKPVTYAKAKNLKQSTLYLPPQVHRKLRQLALDEDKKLHDLLLEAIDLLLAEYELPSIDELTK